MSLNKLLMSPMQFFKKDVISFLIVRRYDLDSNDDQIRYIAVKPNASLWMLRMKLWHLLDLPDFCDEIIVLKTSENIEIPLTELRRGNQPNRPFILEVWAPINTDLISSTVQNNMLTMGNGDDNGDIQSEFSFQSEKVRERPSPLPRSSTLTVSNTPRPLPDYNEMKKCELAARISNTSFIFKLQGKKSKDNFTNLLFKIQNDLSNLTEKLSNLENKIPV